MRTMTHETKKPCATGKKKEIVHKTYGHDSLCKNGAEGLEDVR
jgi:hypothetical protein